MKFPIVETDKNSLVNISGVKTNFYKMKTPDLCSIDPHEFEGFMDGVSLGLNGLKSDCFFKIYRLDNSFYLNATMPFYIPQIELTPADDPLKCFFGDGWKYQETAFYHSHIQQGIKQFRIVSVGDWKGTPLSFNELLPFGNYVISFKRYDKSMAGKFIKGKRKEHSMGRIEKLKNHESSEAYSEADYLLGEILHERESLWQIEVFFIIDSVNGIQELNDKTNRLINALEFEGHKPHIENKTTGLGRVFEAVIPGGSPLFSSTMSDIRSEKVHTSCLRKLLPLHQDFYNEDGVRFVAANGAAVYVNPKAKDLVNYNAFVSGPSGLGKSFVVNKFVQWMAQNKCQVIIVDDGQSFYLNALSLGGEIFNGKINPMQFKDAKYLFNFVKSFIDPVEFGIKKSGELFNAIEEILADHNPSNFTHFLFELDKRFSGISYYFADVKDCFSDEVVAVPSLLYVEGAAFSPRFRAGLVVWLRQASYVMQEAGDTFLIVDEAWKFLRDEQLQFLLEEAKVRRKYGGGLWFISQELSTLYSDQSDFAMALAGNCQTKICFGQDVPEQAKFKKHAIMEIRNCSTSKSEEYSEFVVMRDNGVHPKRLRYYSSPIDFVTFHTDKDKKAHRAAWLNKYEGTAPMKIILERYAEFLNG